MIRMLLAVLVAVLLLGCATSGSNSSYGSAGSHSSNTGGERRAQMGGDPWAMGHM